VDLAVDLELDLALDHHHELVGLVDVVLPDLAGRIDPEVAREAALTPAAREGILVHAGGVRVATHPDGVYSCHTDGDYAEPPCSLLTARAIPRDARPKPVAETATWAARRSSSSPTTTSRA